MQPLFNQLSKNTRSGLIQLYDKQVMVLVYAKNRDFLGLMPTNSPQFLDTLSQLHAQQQQQQQQQNMQQGQQANPANQMRNAQSQQQQQNQQQQQQQQPMNPQINRNAQIVSC